MPEGKDAAIVTILLVLCSTSSSIAIGAISCPWENHFLGSEVQTMAHRYRIFVSFLFIIQSAILLPNVSCGARSTPDSSRNGSHVSSSNPTPGTSASQASPSPTDNEGQSSIRKVDFKNFIYPWYPSYLKPPHGTRQIALHDGKFEVERDEKRLLDNLALELEDVSYADLSGSG